MRTYWRSLRGSQNCAIASWKNFSYLIFPLILGFQSQNLSLCCCHFYFHTRCCDTKSISLPSLTKKPYNCFFPLKHENIGGTNKKFISKRTYWLPCMPSVSCNLAFIVTRHDSIFLFSKDVLSQLTWCTSNKPVKSLAHAFISNFSPSTVDCIAVVWAFSLVKKHLISSFNGLQNKN